MATKAEKVKEIAASLGKSERAIWYWISQGCDIGNPESVRQFVEGKRHRRTNFQRAREKVERAFETAEAGINGKAAGRNGGPPTRRIDAIGDNDLPPLGRRGAPPRRSRRPGMFL